MFRKLSLENFKCFTNDTINFRNITIFTGANATGKSSVIQSILLYEGAMRTEKGEIISVSDAVHVQVGSPKSFVAQNAVGNDDYDFRIGVDDRRISFYVDKENGLDLRFDKECERYGLEISYLNAERIGPRMYYEAGGGDQFASNGSNAVYLIEKADHAGIMLPEQLQIPGTSAIFSHQVEAWMSAVLGEMQLSVKVDGLKAQTELRIRNELTQESVLPTQTGFGISYVLPIITAGLWAAAQKNKVLIVENPEAHLHPSAQSAVGKFLALVADSGVQVIVETHSEHVVDGARVQMTFLQRTGDMLVNYMTHDSEQVKILELNLNSKGELSDWPEGFFDQKQIDLRELFMMGRMDGSKQ